MHSTKNAKKVVRTAQAWAQLRRSFERGALSANYSSTSALRAVLQKSPLRDRRQIVKSVATLRAAAAGIRKLKIITGVRSNTLRGASAKRFLKTLGYRKPDALSPRIKLQLFPYSIQIFGGVGDMELLMGGQDVFYGATISKLSRTTHIGKFFFSRQLLSDPQINLALKSITFCGPPALNLDPSGDRRPYSEVKKIVSRHERQHAFDLVLANNSTFSPYTKRGLEMRLRSELANVGLGSSNHPIRNSSLDILLKNWSSGVGKGTLLSFANPKSGELRKIKLYFNRLNQAGRVLRGKRVSNEKKENARRFLEAEVRAHKEEIIEFESRGRNDRKRVALLIERILQRKSPKKPIGTDSSGAKVYMGDSVMDLMLDSYAGSIVATMEQGKKIIAEQSAWVNSVVQIFTRAHDLGEAIMKRRLISQEAFAEICRSSPTNMLIPTLEYILQSRKRKNE